MKVTCTPPASLESEPVYGLLQIAWRRRSLVLLGVAGAFTLALAYYFCATHLYQATAQLLVVKKRPDAVTGMDTRELSMEDYLATHQAILRSALIIERAITKYNLSSLQCFTGKKGDLTEAIIKGLSVTRARIGNGESDNVLTLSFCGTVADECGIVLNAVISSYQDFLEETYRNISRESLRLIAQARDVLHKELREKEAAYRRFRMETPLLVGKGRDGATIRQERLSTIEAKRSALLLRKAELQGQLAALDAGRKEGSGPEALAAQLAAWTVQGEAARGAQPVIVQEKLHPLLIEQEKLRETWGEKHPEMESLRNRIQATRNLLAGPSMAWRKTDSLAGEEGKPPPADPVDVYREYCKQELRHAEIAEQLLAELYKKEHASARELAAYEIEDEGFRNDIDRQQRLYDSIIKQLQHIDLVKDMGSYDARTISPPGAGKKVRPDARLILSAAAFLGIVAGLGLAFLAEMRDKSLRAPEETRYLLDRRTDECLLTDGESLANVKA
jgi:uncharacterized protein involved in exopolysaccharide biosynthesis